MVTLIGRIESEIIFSELIEKHTDVQVYYGRQPFDAQIASVNGRQLKILRGVPSKNPLFFGRTISIYFKYDGSQFAIDLRVVEEINNIIDLQIISPLCRDIEREHVRMHDVTNMKIEIARASEKPVTINYPITKRAPLEWKSNIRHRVYSSGIAPLFESLQNEMRKYTLEHKIILFRTRKPTHFLEKTMAYMGKPILFPFAGETVPQLATPEELQKACDALHIANSAMLCDQLEKQLRSSNIFFQCYFPVLYYNYCVGYILLTSREAAGRGRIIRSIQYITTNAIYLSQALEAEQYFSDIESSLKFLATDEKQGAIRLKDISIKGLQFQYSSAQPLFALHDRIIITLYLDTHRPSENIQLTAQITRATQERALHTVGVRFTNLVSSVSEELKRALYGTSDAEIANNNP